jgi:hypothetical protein
MYKLRLFYLALASRISPNLYAAESDFISSYYRWLHEVLSVSKFFYKTNRLKFSFISFQRSVD